MGALQMRRRLMHGCVMVALVLCAVSLADESLWLESTSIFSLPDKADCTAVRTTCSADVGAFLQKHENGRRLLQWEAASEREDRWEEEKEEDDEDPGGRWEEEEAV